MNIHPIRIYGLWTEGWVLDYDIINVIPVMDEQNHLQRLNIIRSEMSEALQQAGQALKFSEKSNEIVSTLAHFVRDKGKDWNLHYIVPMPAHNESFYEHTLGYLLAQQLSKTLDIQFLDIILDIQQAIGKKEPERMHDKNILQQDNNFLSVLKEKNVLIFDRHYKQCSMMNKICSLFFHQGHAKNVYVLALIMDKPKRK